MTYSQLFLNLHDLTLTFTLTCPLACGRLNSLASIPMFSPVRSVGKTSAKEYWTYKGINIVFIKLMMIWKSSWTIMNPASYFVWLCLVALCDAQFNLVLLFFLKGELKAEISNFSNMFFAKSNISEVNFVKLFSLVYCLLRENYVRSWIFPAFATSSFCGLKN